MNEFSKGNYDCIWCRTRLTDLGKLLVVWWGDDHFNIHERCCVDVVHRAQTGKELGRMLKDWIE